MDFLVMKKETGFKLQNIDMCEVVKKRNRSKDLNVIPFPTNQYTCNYSNKNAKPKRRRSNLFYIY